MSLHTRVKRRRELREERVPQDGLIFQLPDETLLSIFKEFKTHELIIAAGVCQWFRTIAYDSELWTTVDLDPKPGSSGSLMKFLHRFPRPCTEVLKISGGLLQSKPGKLPRLTKQISTAIQSAYPNLRHLRLSRYDFHANQRAVENITELPANLQELHLIQCDMLATEISGSLSFLQLPKHPSNTTQHLSLRQLEILSFEDSACLRSASIGYLPALCPSLTELNLNGCFRITHTPALVDTLILYSKTLRRLYLGETKINDDTVHSLCRKLKRLNILDIKGCPHVTTNIVENLLTLKQLQKLIANDDIRTLYEQRKLEGD